MPHAANWRCTEKIAKKLRPIVSEAIEAIEAFGDYEVLKSDYIKDKIRPDL